MASPLADAHIEAERRLRLIVAQAVEQIWRSLLGYDRENVDQWLSTVLPVVAAGQRQSVALTEGYLARVLRRQPLGVKPDTLIGAAARKGASPEEVYQRPFVTVWSALSAGVLYDDAVSAGLARATGAAAMDVQLSMRDTLVEVGEADDGIWGYQRVADGNACKFCLAVDGGQFRTVHPMPLHNFCGCGVEPIVYTRGRANAGALDAFNANPTPVPDSVVVHTHGELGPVLTDPSHDFTTAAEALS